MPLLCLLLAACSAPDQVIRQDPPTCGDWTTSKYVADSSSGAFGGSSGFATGVAGGVRVYSWSYQVTGLCLTTPVADNAIQFSVDFKADTTTAFDVNGFVYSQADFSDATLVATVPHFGTNRVVYDATLADLDFARSSSDGKTARVLIEVQVSFPTTGTSAGDLAKLKAELLSIRMETFFHPYTGP